MDRYSCMFKIVPIFYWPVFIGVIFLNAFCTASAQNASPNFIHYSTEHGLPSSEVYSVIQDRKGNLWFSTDRGVARYDGTEFKTYSFKEGLTDNTVFKLLEDKNGKVWMHTLTGRIYFLENDSIIQYKHNELLLEKTLGKIPLGFYVDSLENVSATIRDIGLVKISNDGKAVIPFSYKFFPEIGYLIDEISDEHLLTSVIYPKGKVENIKILFRRGEILDSIPLQIISHDRLCAVKNDLDEIIFSVGKVIFKRKGNKVNLIRELPSVVFFLSLDHNRNLVAGTEQGAYIFDKNDESQILFHFLSEYSVTGILNDREGGYWLTTLDNGVFYTPGYAIQSIRFNQEFLKKPISLTNNNQSVFVGFWSGDLIKFNKGKTHHVYKPVKGTDEFPINNLSSFKNSDSIFLSRTNPGFLRGETFKKFKTKDFLGIKTDFIKHSDGSLYGGGSVLIFRIKDDSLITVGHITHKLNCIAESSDKKILVGTNRGVYIFDQKDKSSVLFHEELNNVRVDDIKWFDDMLVFATMGKGLILFSNNTFSTINESNGLCSDLLNKVLVKDKTIWCISNKGISRVEIIERNPLKYEIVNIFSNDGLMSDEINDITELNDTIYVASNAGVSFFNRHADFVNHAAPPVYVSSFIVNNQLTDFNSEVVLNYKQNDIKIGFNGTSFRSREKVRYRYQLINESDTVFSFTRAQQVEFLSLPSGHYTFHVEAMNNSGVWSDLPATLNFVIKPAWWQTNIFRIVAALVLIVVLIFIFNTRVKRIRKKYEMEKLQASLQLTALRSQMNPHFIFNVMNSIRSFMQNNNLKAAEHYLISFSRLVRYTLDNSETQEVSLNEELTALNSYVDLEKQRFDNGFEFEVICDPDIDTTEITLPSLLLQPFVENSIKHGIARIQTMGRITIRIKKSGKALVVLIEDNGIGLKQNQINNLSSNGKMGPHGMSITFERIRAYNKAFNKSITADISNITNDSGEIVGTRVHLVL